MIQTIKGTRDLLGYELKWFQHIENIARHMFENHGYNEIRTPILEDINIFQRSIGTTSDIVHKEMYDFWDKGGRHVAMRPENTAGVIRAIIQHKLLMSNKQQLLYYIGPMFRYERMQTGRFRQFWQIGTESIGFDNPESEAESMLMLYDLLLKIGLTEIIFSINSIGQPKCRENFYKSLKEFFSNHQKDFCHDCHRRIISNPMRILDCKQLKCIDIVKRHPKIIDYLDEGSYKHHERLKNILTSLQIPFEENYQLVRGLDYYTNTVFEVLSKDLGAQSAILGGGRYNNLIEELGGPSAPAFGWSIGLDRLVMIMQQKKNNTKLYNYPPFLLVPLGQIAYTLAMQLARSCWNDDIKIQIDTSDYNLKKILSSASKLGFKIILILGSDEIENNTITVKYLDTGMQETWNLKDINNKLKSFYSMV